MVQKFREILCHRIACHCRQKNVQIYREYKELF